MLIVVAVSEVAKHSDRLGALIAALPIVTVLVMIWLHLENQGTDKIAAHAYLTFWYVLPTLPMFLLMPYLLHRGVGFRLALAIGAVATMACFGIAAAVAYRLGVRLV